MRRAATRASSTLDARAGQRLSARVALSGAEEAAREAAAAEPVFSAVDICQDVLRRVYMVPEFVGVERGEDECWRLNPFKWHRPPADYRTLDEAS